ncbi:MAG: TIGR01777 family oxidoreductase [Fimbriimonadaceae bacterium]
MKIVLAGGSGFLGRSLAPWLVQHGHEVAVISRHGPIVWDGKTVGPWAEALEGVDALINFAGRSVNCRYNEANRTEIYASRLDSTRVLGDAISSSRTPPRVWLNSSSATIYRHAEDRDMDEATGEIGTGFSVDVCQKWEAELARAETPRTRKAAMRTAMVMGPEPGGAFEAFHRLVRLGLGGHQGRGRQYMSWIHVEDFCRTISWLIECDSLDGPINIASPNPLPNSEFIRVMRETAGMRIGLPAAAWMIQVGTWLMRTEPELVLKSRRVVPGRLAASGFEFKFPEWKIACKEIVKVLSSVVKT